MNKYILLPISFAALGGISLVNFQDKGYTTQYWFRVGTEFKYYEYIDINKFSDNDKDFVLDTFFNPFLKVTNLLGSTANFSYKSIKGAVTILDFVFDTINDIVDYFTYEKDSSYGGGGGGMHGN